MLCHGGCGTRLTPENTFTRTLEDVAQEAGVDVLVLEEDDLRNGNLCEDCALFRRVVGERWQPLTLSLKKLRAQLNRVRIVKNKVILPQKSEERMGT